MLEVIFLNSQLDKKATLTIKDRNNVVYSLVAMPSCFFKPFVVAIIIIFVDARSKLIVRS